LTSRHPAATAQLRPLKPVGWQIHILFIKDVELPESITLAILHRESGLLCCSFKLSFPNGFRRFELNCTVTVVRLLLQMVEAPAKSVRPAGRLTLHVSDVQSQFQRAGDTLV
jgi:hypothetical protein